MKNNIGPFKRYSKKPNDICYGYLYTYEIVLPIYYAKKRTLRLYLPEDFDESKQYPLLIMSDGQNIVDKYTSSYGSWDIDIRMHELILMGYHSFICVGIDCPKKPLYRNNEYSFPNLTMYDENNVDILKSLKSESYELYQYINNQLIPLLKEHFNISEDIATCGSSMGGIYALAMLLTFPETIKTALCFSPAYFLYKKKDLNAYLDNKISSVSKDHKFFFYVGEVDYEKLFVKDTKLMKQYFFKKGYNTQLVIDSNGEHNESTWSNHFIKAIKFWLGRE